VPLGEKLRVTNEAISRDVKNPWFSHPSLFSRRELVPIFREDGCEVFE